MACRRFQTLLKDRLLEDNLVTSISANFDYEQWTEEFFCDGQFIRIAGLMRLMNYTWVSKMMEPLPKMLRTAQNAETIDRKQMRASWLIDRKEFESKQNEQQRQLSKIKPLKMDEITGLISQLHGDVVRVKVLPNRDHPEKVLIGSGELANFHDTTASLIQKYGYEIDAEWDTLSQINLSQVLKQSIFIPTGNPIEDSFEQVPLAFNNVIRMANAAKFPTVSFTPISIYRTVEA